MKKKGVQNPLAIGMSYETRLKRYHQDKDELLRKKSGLPAEEFSKELKKLEVWWNI